MLALSELWSSQVPFWEIIVHLAIVFVNLLFCLFQCCKICTCSLLRTQKEVWKLLQSVFIDVRTFLLTFWWQLTDTQVRFEWSYCVCVCVLIFVHCTR